PEIRHLAIGQTASRGEESMEATPIDPPKLQGLARRLIEKHRRIALRGIEIAAIERNRAGGLDQYLAEREHVLVGDSRFDEFLDQAHRLVGKSLQPENARQKALRGGALVKDVADHLGADHWRSILIHHACDVAPGFLLVAHEMKQVADHTVADET